MDGGETDGWRMRRLMDNSVFLPHLSTSSICLFHFSTFHCEKAKGSREREREKVRRRTDEHHRTERKKSLRPCQRHMLTPITTSSYEHQETHTHTVLLFGGSLRPNLN